MIEKELKANLKERCNRRTEKAYFEARFKICEILNKANLKSRSNLSDWKFMLDIIEMINKINMELEKIGIVKEKE